MSGWEVERLVKRARRLGAVFSFEPDESPLLDAPESFDEELLTELVHHRDEIKAFLQDEAREQEALRRWLPSLGAAVKDRDTGREGRIWGATRNGVIVDFEDGTPLISMRPTDVTPAVEWNDRSRPNLPQTLKGKSIGGSSSQWSAHVQTWPTNNKTPP